jgi:hypothetical protein
MPRLALLAALIPFLSLVWLPDSLEGQGPPMAVQGQQDLSFGDLLGGLTKRVDPGDPTGAAQIRVRGGRQTVELSFILPGALSANGGGSIPLHFGPGDAFFSESGHSGDRQPFDPTTPWTVTLDQPGWRWIYLGGTALPPPASPLGEYSGTITLTISDLGS